AQPGHLAGTSRREGLQTRPPVRWVRGYLHVPLVLQVPNLPGYERRMNVLQIGDLRGTDHLATGDDLQQAQGGRADTLAGGPVQAADEGEEGNDHRLDVTSVGSHESMLL